MGSQESKHFLSIAHLGLDIYTLPDLCSYVGYIRCHPPSICHVFRSTLSWSFSVRPFMFFTSLNPVEQAHHYADIY